MVATIAHLTVGTTDVRELDGLFSLNDLHRAAGGDSKHQPGFFLRNEQTQALMQEIDSANLQSANLAQKRGSEGFPGSNVLKINKGGLNPGTFACRELVVAYAAWISATFHLQVIRIFLAAQSAPIKKEIIHHHVERGPIHQQNGWYSLNDFHRTSGLGKQTAPSAWLALHSTQHMISKIRSEVPYITRRGVNGGIYACHEVTVAYVWWLGVDFYKAVAGLLAVIDSNGDIGRHGYAPDSSLPSPLPFKEPPVALVPEGVAPAVALEAVAPVVCADVDAAISEAAWKIGGDAAALARKNLRQMVIGLGGTEAMQRIASTSLAAAIGVEGGGAVIEADVGDSGGAAVEDSAAACPADKELV